MEKHHDIDYDDDVLVEYYPNGKRVGFFARKYRRYRRRLYNRQLEHQLYGGDIELGENYKNQTIHIDKSRFQYFPCEPICLTTFIAYLLTFFGNPIGPIWLGLGATAFGLLWDCIDKRKNEDPELTMLVYVWFTFGAAYPILYWLGHRNITNPIMVLWCMPLHKFIYYAPIITVGLIALHRLYVCYKLKRAYFNLSKISRIFV
jgi:hypothetical protein